MFLSKTILGIDQDRDDHFMFQKKDLLVLSSLVIRKGTQQLNAFTITLLVSFLFIAASLSLCKLDSGKSIKSSFLPL